VCLERSHRPHLLLAAAFYTAVINQDEPWWVGWVEEVPCVTAQERSRTALLASLPVVLREALKLIREEARKLQGPATRNWFFTL
jgi:predicted RNase H-like HicB family nuclease